ncbi:flagellar hook-associated protein FlgK [Alicyclobacillaceae bacterium I2511]|nr:flagellar hook-associated protein FlgK [Alicyclobacillaceae bacterium I2511]
MGTSTFLGLNIGLSALQTAQQAENVTANNIANANTPGYARETLQIAEGLPIPPAGQTSIAGQMGTGSVVTSVNRVTNSFINQQDRANQGTNQEYQVLNQNWTELQGILNEPSSVSLQNSMDQFFQSIQSLSTDPTDPAAQQTVVSQAQTFANTYNTIVGQLEQMQQGLLGAVQGQATQLSTYAAEVASLNTQIATINAANPPSSGGAISAAATENPNTLLDQRSAILDQMAQLANITVGTPASDGTVTVSLGGQSLVSSSGASTVSYTPPATTFAVTPPSGSSGSLPTSSIASGAISGNLQGIDATSEVLSGLSQFVSTFSNQVNSSLSSPGWLSTTSDPNAPSSLVTMGEILNVSSSPSLTVSAQTASALENTQQASLTSSPSYLTSSFGNFTTGTGTFDQLLGSLVATVGTQAASAQAEGQTASALATQSSNLRQSVSGVDTNEELANMVQYQNSYNAAAKFISVIDQMLQTLISDV